MMGEPAVFAPDAKTLQNWYQSVIERYKVDSIDFDLENQALNPQYYAIRDQALVGLEQANPGLKAADVQESFAAHKADIAVVAAYGLILPRATLKAVQYMACAVPRVAT